MNGKNIDPEWARRINRTGQEKKHSYIVSDF